MGEHDDVETLIPWYEGGELTSGERALVERHLERCGDCRGLLEQARLQRAHLAAHSAAELLAHVEPALLTHYAERPDDLEPETRNWIERKLTECDACHSAYERLRAVDVEPARSPRPQPAPSFAERAWVALSGTILHPAPALAYLLLVALLAPALLWRAGRDGAPALPAPLLRVEGESVLRDPGDAAEPTPLSIPAGDAGGAVVLLLETRLVSTDLSAGRLSFLVDLRRDERTVWSRDVAASEFELRDGRAVLPIVLRTDLLPRDREHVISIRAIRPGDPVHGQPLFRRRLILESRP